MLKLKEIVRLSIVKDKYLRFNFDAIFHVVEDKGITQGGDGYMTALVNLLCFGFVVAGVELLSLFACAQVWLCEEKLIWREE